MPSSEGDYWGVRARRCSTDLLGPHCSSPLVKPAHTCLHYARRHGPGPSPRIEGPPTFRPNSLLFPEHVGGLSPPACSCQTDPGPRSHLVLSAGMPFPPPLTGSLPTPGITSSRKLSLPDHQATFRCLLLCSHGALVHHVTTLLLPVGLPIPAPEDCELLKGCRCLIWNMFSSGPDTRWVHRECGVKDWVSE